MARTKQTGKPHMSSVPSRSTYTPSPMVKSPPQPAELSDADRAKIKSWLDEKQPKPFDVTTIPFSRKRKRTDGMLLQADLYEDRLSVHYEIKPRDKWECLRRYKKFTVGSESIGIGQCVLVKHNDPENLKEEFVIDLPSQWKARVLEVRALDSEHVYIRVAWLNRPEDLSIGRKPHHGKNELIPSNQMDIIDAMAVNGSLEVMHWDEADDESALMNEDQYFWRQTYDFAGSKSFSILRTICFDDKPQNPDEMILQCGNKDCRKWLHVKCIAEHAVQQAEAETEGTKKPPTKKVRTKHVSISANSLAQAKAESDSFTAEVLIEGLPSGNKHCAAKETEIVIVDATGKESTRSVHCLCCHQAIE